MSKQVQFNDLLNNPPNCMAVALRNFNYSTWVAAMYGPKESPYEGGIFRLNIDFPNTYPRDPPVLIMTTPIYHPNIDDEGFICIDIIRGSWQSNYTMRFILNSVVGILKYPNPSSPWPSKQNIANEIVFDYQKYFYKAQDLTRRYAY